MAAFQPNTVTVPLGRRAGDGTIQLPLRGDHRLFLGDRVTVYVGSGTTGGLVHLDAERHTGERVQRLVLTTEQAEGLAADLMRYAEAARRGA